MKNNSLVFLGFVIICLVNISAKSWSHHPAKPAPPAPMKMAVTPVANAPVASSGARKG